MKQLIKRYAPSSVVATFRSLVARIAFVTDFAADYRRYARSALSSEGVSANMTPTQLEAQITKDYHRVEKGLALANPKRPFGADVSERLAALVPRAEAAAPSASYLTPAAAARSALARWNTTGEIDEQVAPTSPRQSAPSFANAEELFETRHSVRDFAEKRPSRESIERALALAMRSPSVCNRQPWSVRLYAGESVSTVLQHQNGNRGFAGLTPVVALVSVDVAHFAGPGERNQAWIEGGIFASTFVWALHSIGIASCMLNLSLTTSRANALRTATGMKANEIPIMMIAIGEARPGHRIARSRRRELDELVVDAWWRTGDNEGDSS